MASLLLLTIFLPLLGVGVIWAVAPSGRGAVRLAALVISVVTLLLAGVVVAGYLGQASAGGEYAVTDVPWLGSGSVIDVAMPEAADGAPASKTQTRETTGPNTREFMAVPPTGAHWRPLHDSCKLHRVPGGMPCPRPYVFSVLAPRKL